jgi:pSer/pThr/pTyr-binding forkhead associated (FHA) protein
MSSRAKGDWTDDRTSEISVAPVTLAPEQMHASLEMVQGPGAPRTHPLDRAECVVGRAVDADIVINSTDLSRRHVAFRRAANGQVSLVDLDSRNGAFLNGIRVHSAVLHEGDSVQLGSIVFVFREAR